MGGAAPAVFAAGEGFRTGKNTGDKIAGATARRGEGRTILPGWGGGIVGPGAARGGA